MIMTKLWYRWVVNGPMVFFGPLGLLGLGMVATGELSGHPMDRTLIMSLLSLIIALIGQVVVILVEEKSLVWAKLSHWVSSIYS